MSVKRMSYANKPHRLHSYIVTVEFQPQRIVTSAVRFCSYTVQCTSYLVR